MFNNTALDVVIGIVLVYLLYSMLITILGEYVSTKPGIRTWRRKEDMHELITNIQDIFNGLRENMEAVLFFIWHVPVSWRQL